MPPKLSFHNEFGTVYWASLELSLQNVSELVHETGMLKDTCFGQPFR